MLGVELLSQKKKPKKTGQKEKKEIDGAKTII